MLVVATVIQTKKRKKSRGEKRRGSSDLTDKFKNTNTGKAFQLDLQNRFRILQEEQELTIDSFNQVLLIATNKKILGY